MGANEIGTITTSSQLYQEIAGECFDDSAKKSVVIQSRTDETYTWELSPDARRKTTKCVTRFAPAIFADNATLIAGLTERNGVLQSQEAKAQEEAQGLKLVVEDLKLEQAGLVEEKRAVEEKLSDLEKRHETLAADKAKQVKEFNKSIAAYEHKIELLGYDVELYKRGYKRALQQQTTVVYREYNTYVAPSAPVEREEPIHRGGFGCFPGTASVLTKEGPMTFDELAAIVALKDALPEVASYDENTGATVYQQPTLLIDHGVIPGNLMEVVSLNEDGETLRLDVTDNHRLYVYNEAKGYHWKAAGALADGDSIVGDDDRQYRVDLNQTTSTPTSLRQFNLSFSADETGMVPTYLVSSSPETGDWFVAHNDK